MTPPDPVRPALAAALVVAFGLALPPSAAVPAHPRVLFDAPQLADIRSSSASPALAPLRRRVMARAEHVLSARPLVVSHTGRGEPDPPGELKGLESARRLQGRVVTCALAFLLSGDRHFRDAAVQQLDHALGSWWTWVDTAHQPPYDLMTGETSLTFGLAYDWLYNALTPQERVRLREGAERRALRPYLAATAAAKPMFWFTAAHNWNPVCNGGAAALSLAIGEEDRELTDEVLARAAPAMARYWEHLQPDGGWDEGTGYWTYGHRYAFMAADALRRAGWREGREFLGREGGRNTGYFPLAFNPGRSLSASFGDSSHRASDALFYFLAREYQNPDFAWFQDRATPQGPDAEGWPQEALALVWRASSGEAGKPAVAGGEYRPRIPAIATFPSIGWAMLAPSQPDPPFFLAFKNGSLAANHTHLDLNHVSVGVGDTMLLVDLGSRPYPADYFDGQKRYAYYEISTAGHNTVLIDGRGQVPGRQGALKGPFMGPGYSAFVGQADGAYGSAATRARRHVVFVDRRYFVLVDEIEATKPVPVELRFHTYGQVAPLADCEGGWSVTDGGRALDVLVAHPAAVQGTVDTPAGWIRPVRVLRLTSRRADLRLVLATAIVPEPAGAGRRPTVSQQRRDGGLQVAVGADRLMFDAGSDGLRLAGVTLPGGVR